jgi:hypothetical protein
MDNPGRLATLGTQDTGRRKGKKKKSSTEHKSMRNTDPHKSEDEPRCSIIINTTVKIRIIDKLSDTNLF